MDGNDYLAVYAASQRGVSCRVLVDALGARPWWKGRQPERLRAAGVQIRPALSATGFDVEVLATEGSGHAREIARTVQSSRNPL